MPPWTALTDLLLAPPSSGQLGAKSGYIHLERVDLGRTGRPGKGPEQASLRSVRKGRGPGGNGRSGRRSAHGGSDRTCATSCNTGSGPTSAGDVAGDPRACAASPSLGDAALGRRGGGPAAANRTDSLLGAVRGRRARLSALRRREACAGAPHRPRRTDHPPRHQSPGHQQPRPSPRHRPPHPPPERHRPGVAGDDARLFNPGPPSRSAMSWSRADRLATAAGARSQAHLARQRSAMQAGPARAAPGPGLHARGLESLV